MPTKPEGPAQEPQMSEPTTHKLPESLPYQMMIGDLRRCLFTRGDSAWNDYIRDMTAELEEEGEYVNVAEAFSRINAKAAKMMGVLEFQKAMGVPATPAPSQPAGAREVAEQIVGDVFPSMDAKNTLRYVEQAEQRLVAFLAQQTAAKDAEMVQARAQRDWLIAECARVGVTVNVIIGAPLEKAYRLDNAAERERDDLLAENAALKARLAVTDDMEAHDDR